MPSRMGFSAGMDLSEWYGAAPAERNKCAYFHRTAYRTVTPAGVDCTTSDRSAAPTVPDSRFVGKEQRGIRHSLFFEQPRLRRQFDRPFLVRRRRHRELVEEPAGPEQEPRPV